MKVLIIGSGRQGSDVAKYLVQKPDVELIKMTDIDAGKANAVAESSKSKKVIAGRLDAGNVNEIVEAAKGMDVVVNAVVSKYNLTIMDGALKARANYIDMASGPPYDNIEKQLALYEKWREKGLTALMNTGASPGVVNVVIATLCDKLDEVDEINVIGGSQVKRGTKFLEGKEVLESTWSPETELSDVLSPPVVFEDGQWKTVPPFSGEEEYAFPEPLGPCTVVDHIHEEIYTIPRFIGKGLRKMHVKFGWHPLLLIYKGIFELGLYDDKPVDVKGVKVTPRELLIRLLKPIPTKEQMIKKIENNVPIETVGGLMIEVKGKKGSIKTSFKCYYGYGSEIPPLQALKEYGPSFLDRPGIIGLSAAISAHMLGRGDIKTRGVIPPECLTSEERKTFLTLLVKEGFVYSVTEDTQLI